MFTKQIECPNCGYEGKGKRVGADIFKSVMFMIIALLFCWTLIVPLFYLIWAIKNFNNQVCPKCGYKDVVIK